jgi:hypothetical protein
MLLLGYPPDYGEDEFVVNTISSFGRVISWVDDGHHLSRNFVRACVIDYESIPQFLVTNDGKGLQGETWTIQCEVLQGHLLGGLPQDEDPALGPDDFPLGGPFDIFGFRQVGHGPATQPNQQIGPNPPVGFGGIQGHNFVKQDNKPAEVDWNGGPEDVNDVPDFNLNEELENPPDLDMNTPADMQEMIIDPITQGPQPQEMFLELNDLLNQVNEEEEMGKWRRMTSILSRGSWLIL